MKINLVSTFGNSATLNCESVYFIPDTGFINIFFTEQQYNAFRAFYNASFGRIFFDSETTSLCNSDCMVTIKKGIFTANCYSCDF